ncbi:glycosyltransferase [Planctomycetes bacterium K23_9]|uniref:GDP-mannose-dependent alpha-(1-6)-phosphatidylinositol monomannoside mannosyltransferase n=1 Tax=Stieleria marina TaxID=1930275 RepID=A0A517NR36_9BACT|nr:GDP-mannose-dependent alpha-(1-6)-phosphatidylinositol monomannoside mannosyltransferase [Planctomycetes bacterium K23_9]
MFQRKVAHPTMPENRDPLRVMFVHTEVVVGGAETLLLEIIRKMDRARFEPELVCLKQLSELGEVIAKEIPTHVGLLENKYDVKVLGRLTQLLKDRKTDAVVTVGTGGDRMFWGRLAAWRANVPVILSALHATGYPMKVERMNRMLSPITDGFIGCARTHSEFLVQGEGCPENKVFTVWNGVDVDRFQPRDKAEMRARIGIDANVPTAGIVAALRPEKQHVMLVQSWAKVVQQLPNAVLVVIGDGVEREAIEQATAELGLEDNVRMLGMRHDVPEVLAGLDLKVLSSRMEANPASTLEANACGLPVVAPNVGSLPDTVVEGETGYLYEANNVDALAESMLKVLSSEDRGAAMGVKGRKLVCERFSVEVMVQGYEQLIDGVYRAAQNGKRLTPQQYDDTMEELIQEIAAQRDRVSPAVAAITMPGVVSGASIEA